MKDIIIFDIETDGLEATKIHCLSYYKLHSDVKGSLTSYEDIKKFMEQDVIYVAHNGVRYDIPTLKRILNINFIGVILDTLPMSWTVYPNMKKHGLETWGNIFGVKKPVITDWENQTLEEYINRCEEDVTINTLLWRKCFNDLFYLYKDKEEILRYCEYLSFKMDCVLEQEQEGIKLDVEHCEKELSVLLNEKESKTKELLSVMPKVAIKKKKVYENAVEDINGNVFTKGDLFFNSVAKTTSTTIEKVKITGTKDANANSSSQIKDWLYALGWKPENIKHQRDKKTGEVKQIPQIASVNGQGEVCNSIKKLYQKEPKLEVLDGLSVISHRISIFKGFLKNQINSRLYPTCMGLTNTLRLQHSVVVNLPSIYKKYGAEIRSCLVADEGFELAGSDLSGIEDNTKRHYIYKYDPDYVEEMNTKGFDSHLDIAVLAGLLTKEQVENHKNKTEDYSEIRQKAKVVNFSATYKVGAATLARNGGFKLSFAKKLLDTFWKRNNAILKVENDLEIKELNGQKWLLNPVSKFWYTLRNEKDKFSTLNQSTAVYVFDLYVKYIRKQGQKIAYQCHDEWLGNIKDKEETNITIQNAIEQVNEELKLNVKIGCSVDYGNNYAQCH